MTVSAISSGVSSGLVANSGNDYRVTAGGTADGFEVSSGGFMLVDGGVTSDTMINGGFLQVSAGGAAISSFLFSGSQTLYAGGTASFTLVAASGFEAVSSGGITYASMDHGSETIYAGGTAIDTQVADGGNLTVISGTIISTTVVGANDFISEGVFYPVFHSVTVDSGAIAIATMVGSAGVEIVSGGTASGTVVNGTQGFAQEFVEAGGTTSGTVVSSGGEATVYSPIGTAGAMAVGTVVSSGGFENVNGGGQTSGTVVFNGGTQDVSIEGLTGIDLPAALTFSTVVSSGGVEYLSDSGTSIGTVVSAGGSEIVNNGFASGTVVYAGGSEIVNNGFASGTVVNAGGTEIINTSSGVASATILDVGGTIDIATLTFIGVGSASLSANNVLSVKEGHGSYTQTLAGDYANADVQIVGQDSGTGTLITLDSTPCYCRGTLIRTDRGDVAVEALAVGDRVVTYAGATAPVRWIGHRRVACRSHPDAASVWPVLVAADAFAARQPQRDLLLSPEHAVFVEGVLIPIRHLINGASIVQIAVEDVEYWHVELDRHDVLLAENLPAESYLDTGNRRAFANGGDVVQMHPAFSADRSCELIWEARGYASLRIEGEAVGRVAARLRRRAMQGGFVPARRKARRLVPHRATTTDLCALVRPAWYMATYADVAAAGIDATEHYAGWGRSEGRLPCPEAELVRALGLIDPLMLAIDMPDIISAGADPVAHFCTLGWQEQRRPNPYFDTGWYLDTYDVTAGMNPLVHYVLVGEGQGLRPGRHFDPAWYRQRYAIEPAESALAHYLMHRRTRRVSPLPSFDVDAYSQSHTATLLPERDPYMHYLASGDASAQQADMGSGDAPAIVGAQPRCGFGGR
jgi:autotransporter passenger strand-loop-strand repeat protein